MKVFIILVAALCLPLADYAQTRIDKTIPVKAGEKISLRFDFPELIRITTWDKNEISIQGTVSINSGEHDEAFVLENSNANGTVSVRSEIRDMKNIPQRYTILKDGQKLIFPSKEELNKYQRQSGTHYSMMTCGVDMDIVLDIKVPRNAPTTIESVYGMVEVTGFAGPLSVVATYGGVDAALTERTTGELTAETNHGEIYTNLDAKFNGDMKNDNFHIYVTATPGTGPSYSFESKFGNVYLRKAN